MSEGLSNSGADYAEFVHGLLDSEEAYRTSLESRGISVITSSGVMVTLLFGLSTLATRAQTFTLSTFETVLLGIGLALFTIAATCAIGVYAPSATRFVNPHTLAERLKSHWDAPPSTAMQMITGTRINLLVATRRTNRRKAKLLLAATITQVLAVLAVASAVGLILRAA